MDEIRRQRTEELNKHTYLLDLKAILPEELWPAVDKQIRQTEKSIRRLARATKPVYNERRAIGSGIIAYGDLDS